MNVVDDIHSKNIRKKSTFQPLTTYKDFKQADDDFQPKTNKIYTYITDVCTAAHWTYTRRRQPLFLPLLAVPYTVLDNVKNRTVQ